MRKVLLVVMLAAASLAFGLDKDVAKRALDREQAVAVRYQEQVVANQNTVQAMSDDAKMRDYTRRLTYLRQQIYIRQYEFDKRFTTLEKRSELAGEIKTFTDQHAQLLHEFEMFVNGLQ
jgi:Cu2+-containing amine oxidase